MNETLEEKAVFKTDEEWKKIIERETKELNTPQLTIMLLITARTLAQRAMKLEGKADE